MKCYRKGGCGPYEMLPCGECPASKPEYLKRYDDPKPEPRKRPARTAASPLSRNGAAYARMISGIRGIAKSLI